ncbi:MAG TPA: tetratricopeptide repeat protein [Candidatus Methanoperedens sp.]|nr:tetratricopeptide repeat protein [Candidatus Methanoperedens sp.]
MALLAVLGVAVAAFPPPGRAAFKNVEVGASPPPFAMRDSEGRLRESAALFGKGATVVVFWATWSPRSQEILADLERLRAELGPERVAVVAVNVEHLAISAADRDAVRSVVAETKSTATVLFDEGLVAFNAYGTMAVPSTLVVDAQRRVSFTLAGYPMTMRSDLADAVRKALGLPTSAELRPPEEPVPKNHALMYYNFGRRLLEKGQDEKAEEQLRIAVERDPQFKKPYLELGLLAVRRGEAQRARELFGRVREIDPHDPEATYQAAAASLRAGALEDAAALFAELAAEFPDRGGYLLGLALAQKFLAREAEYRAGLARAAGVRPPEPRMLYDLGAAAEGRGQLPLAAELYRRALGAALR